MDSATAGSGFNESDESKRRLEFSEWQHRVRRRTGFARGGTDSALALLAACNAIEAAIETGELRATGAMLSAHCDRVHETHVALIDLARIANDGAASAWPTRDRAMNFDAWHNSYVKLADRISRGKVDLERPLKPLAALVAHQCYVKEREKQRQLFPLSEGQPHRLDLAPAASPEADAEASRRRRVLRRELRALLSEGQLTRRELDMLTARYVREVSSQEVAAEMQMTPANVRQLCRRRCSLIRHRLSGLELGDAEAA